MLSTLRRAALASTFTLAVALAAAPAANAISDGFDPSLMPPTYPGSSAPADAWKLVGSSQHKVSNTLVTPRWIIASGHAGLGLSHTYYAPNGQTSAVLAHYKPASEPGVGASDISVSLLATPIAAPAGGFPTLLADMHTRAISEVLPGYVLWAGQGGSPTWPVPQAQWSRPDGRPAPGAPIFGHVGGDSGSTGFYYPRAGATPMIAGITGGGGIATALANTDVQFGDELRGADAGHFSTVADWLRAQFAKHPTVPPPTWTTLAEAGLGRDTLRPPAPRNLEVAVASSTGIGITWEHAEPTGIPRTGYRITVTPGSTPGGDSFLVPPDRTSFVRTGLRRGTTYKLTVRAVNANGESPTGRSGVVSRDLVTSDSSLDEPDNVSYLLRAAPSQVGDLRVTGERTAAASGVAYCARVSWEGATTDPGTSITKYLVTINGTAMHRPQATGDVVPSAVLGPDGRYEVRHCGLDAEQSVTASVRARSDVTLGPVTTASGTTPAGAPAGTPFPNPTDLELTPRRKITGGATDYCIRATWTPPVLPAGFELGDTLVVAHPEHGEVSGAADLPPTTASHELCGLQPGESHRVEIINSIVGVSHVQLGTEGAVSTPTGAPLGTPLGAPTAAETSSRIVNAADKVDYCATLSWQPPATVDGFPVASYQVVFRTSDFSQVKLAPTVPADSNPLLAVRCGLTPSTDYLAVLYVKYQTGPSTQSTVIADPAPVRTPAESAAGTSTPAS